MGAHAELQRFDALEDWQPCQVDPQEINPQAISIANSAIWDSAVTSPINIHEFSKRMKSSGLSSRDTILWSGIRHAGELLETIEGTKCYAMAIDPNPAFRAQGDKLIGARGYWKKVEFYDVPKDADNELPRKTRKAMSFFAMLGHEDVKKPLATLGNSVLPEGDAIFVDYFADTTGPSQNFKDIWHSRVGSPFNPVKTGDLRAYMRRLGFKPLTGHDFTLEAIDVLEKKIVGREEKIFRALLQGNIYPEAKRSPYVLDATVIEIFKLVRLKRMLEQGHIVARHLQFRKVLGV